MKQVDRVDNHDGREGPAVRQARRAGLPLTALAAMVGGLALALGQAASAGCPT